MILRVLYALALLFSLTCAVMLRPLVPLVLLSNLYSLLIVVHTASAIALSAVEWKSLDVSRADNGDKQKMHDFV